MVLDHGRCNLWNGDDLVQGLFTLRRILLVFMGIFWSWINVGIVILLL
jgi:hypothetical protein